MVLVLFVVLLVRRRSGRHKSQYDSAPVAINNELLPHTIVKKLSIFEDGFFPSPICEVGTYSEQNKRTPTRPSYALGTDRPSLTFQEMRGARASSPDYDSAMESGNTLRHVPQYDTANAKPSFSGYATSQTGNYGNYDRLNRALGSRTSPFAEPLRSKTYLDVEYAVGSARDSGYDLRPQYDTGYANQSFTNEPRLGSQKQPVVTEAIQTKKGVFKSRTVLVAVSESPYDIGTAR